MVDLHNTCQVVIGSTSILVFDDSEFSRMEATRSVKSGLKNGIFFEIFAGFVVRTEYRAPISEALVYSPSRSDPDDSHLSSVTTSVAVAAASITFLVASIFCYGMLKKDFTRHPEPSVRHNRNRSRKFVARTVISGSRGGSLQVVGTRRNFVRLEDLAVSNMPFPIGPSAPVEDTPTTTWSVSDITSVSDLSHVSRSTSALERIVEENEEDYYDDFNGRYFDVDDDGYDADSYHSECSRRSGLRSIREIDEDDDEYSDEKSDFVEARLADFDCVGERQDQVMDVSDLDAVFTINSGTVDHSRGETIDDTSQQARDVTASVDGEEGECGNKPIDLPQDEMPANSGDSSSDTLSHAISPARAGNLSCDELESGMSDKSQASEVLEDPKKACEQEEDLYLLASDVNSKVEDKDLESLCIPSDNVSKDIKDNFMSDHNALSPELAQNPVIVSNGISCVSDSSVDESMSDETGISAHSPSPQECQDDKIDIVEECKACESVDFDV
jgi:hypothetical protein